MTLEEHLRAEIAKAGSLPELATSLEKLLQAGVSVFRGQLIFIRKEVARFDGLVISIYPREHVPPHFHVKGNGIDAAFAITDCAVVAGDPDRGTVSLIQFWHTDARPKLVKIWNATRPSDCPVGPLPEE